MSRKHDKIDVLIHIPDNYSRQSLTEETNKLYVYSVKKYLDNSDLGPDEKKEIIKILISKFG